MRTSSTTVDDGLPGGPFTFLLLAHSQNCVFFTSILAISEMTRSFFSVLVALDHMFGTPPHRRVALFEIV